jgi:competence protein ComEC
MTFKSYDVFDGRRDFLSSRSLAHKTQRLETLVQIKSEVNFSDFDMNFFASDLNNNFDDMDYKVTGPKREDFRYGDCLKVTGTLSLPESSMSSKKETLYNFPYKEYLAKDNVYLLYKVKTFKKIENCPELSVYKKVKLFFLNKKQEITKIFLEKYDQPYAGLVAGVLIAGKGLMNKDTLEMFKIVSLSHVIVLSGSNVSIIIFCIKYIFDLMFVVLRIRENLFVEIIKKILIMLSITSFVLLTGGGAPIYRAFISSFCALVIFKKNTSQIYALTIVVLIMTIVNPFGSIYDPSFHLTCCATYGLILFSKYFDEVMIYSRLNFLPNFLREIISVTLATQVFVFPYIIFMSGSFSAIFLLSNVLVLPVIPFIMLFGFLSLFPWVDGLFIFINNILLHAVFCVVDFLSRVPYGYVVFDMKMSVMILLVYGVFVLGLVYKIKNTRAG